MTRDLDPLAVAIAAYKMAPTPPVRPLVVQRLKSNVINAVAGPTLPIGATSIAVPVVVTASIVAVVAAIIVIVATPKAQRSAIRLTPVPTLQSPVNALRVIVVPVLVVNSIVEEAQGSWIFAPPLSRPEPLHVEGATPPRSHPVDVELLTERAFQKGWAALHAGRTSDARAAFSEVIRLAPKSELADDATFWTGIAFKQEHRDVESRAAFGELLRRYPSSIHRDDARHELESGLP